MIFHLACCENEIVFLGSAHLLACMYILLILLWQTIPKNQNYLGEMFAVPRTSLDGRFFI